MTSGFAFNRTKPPVSPMARRSSFVDGDEDTAKYMRVPDDDFSRPYIAVPGGIAFIWPLGVEGFEMTIAAELGKHKYLGEIELDVDITHKAEKNIVLSGVFPGWTSVDNMLALERVFNADTPERGKILHLPGILPNLQYVVCQDGRFSHAEEDRTRDLAYSFTCVKVGLGKPGPVTSSAQSTVSSEAPTDAEPRGSLTRQASAQPGQNTLRQFARTFLGNANLWTTLYADPRNKALFDSRNVPSHQVPDFALPTGTTVWV